MNELVELIKISPKILLDIRYATTANFTGQIIYKSSRCFLLKKTAERVHKVQQKLEKMGLGLKVFDGYRPPSAQRIFWQLVPDPRFVADPKVGSVHTRGASLDLTLVRDGIEVEMPSFFDDFTEKASHHYAGASQKAIENRKFLEEIMKSERFVPYEYEWWHYNDPDWKDCPLLDVDIPS